MFVLFDSSFHPYFAATHRSDLDLFFQFAEWGSSIIYFPNLVGIRDDPHCIFYYAHKLYGNQDCFCTGLEHYVSVLVIDN